MASRKRGRFLGRSIGAGAFGDPRDGDGDGFYSPRQGMPDKTPVPRKVPVPLRAAGMPLIDDAGGKSDPKSLKDRARRAAATAKDIETQVLKKHGNIRNRKTALTALNKTFPNLGSVPRMEPDLFDEDDDRNSELSDSEYNFMVALLHSGELSPSAARRLVKISNKDGDPISGGSLYGGVRWETMEWSGMHLSLNRNVTIEEIRQIDTSNMAFPVAYQIAQTMDEMGTFSDDEINRVLQQNLAFHEMGHAMHWDYGLTHFGIEPEDNYSFLPIELAKDGVVDGIHNFLKIPRKTLEDAWDQYFKKAKEIDPDGEDFEFSEIATMRLIQSAAKSWEKQIGDTLSDEEIFALEDSALDGIAARITWDGTPEAKRDAIRRALASVSIYSENGMDDNHGVSYMEGTAESIALRLSDPDGNLGLPSEASEMLNSIDAIKSKQLATVALESISADDLIQMGEELEQKPDKRFRTRLPELTNDRYGFNPPRTSKPFGSKSKGSTTKKDFYEVDIESKILGIGIGGRRGRSGRGGRRFKPVDGDGDGFYSPRPGMPDKTPVPLRSLSLPGLPIPSKRALTPQEKKQVQRASTEAKKIEDQVLKKHGNIRNRKTAIESLNKSFPSLKAQTLIAERGSGSDLNDSEFNYMVALLHAADLNPSTAKRIVRLNEEDKPPAFGGYCDSGLDWETGKCAGFALGLNLKTTIQNIRTAGFNAPWAFQTMENMKLSGDFSDAEINQVLQQNIAFHEMGHAAHFDFGLRSFGIEAGDYDSAIPIELYKKASVNALFQSLSIRQDILAQGWDDEFAQLKSLFPDKSDHKLAEMATVRLGETALLTWESVHGQQLSKDRHEQVYDSLGNALYSEIAWDGVAEINRERIKESLSSVSKYASATQGFDEGLVHLEGTAESLAIRISDPNASAALGPKARRMLNEIQGKADNPFAKMSDEQILNIFQEARKQIRNKNIRKLPSFPTDKEGFNRPKLGPLNEEKFTKVNGKTEFVQKEIDSKVLGISIGKRRRKPGRGGRRFVPKDGDGDGFYSPAPGMPDKTPVVVQPVVALGEEAFLGGSESERALRVASETAKAIEKSVTDKFGPLKTQRQVHEALHKAFPKAKRADIATLAAANSDDDVLPVSRNFAIGLLHGSMLKPKTAKRITSVGKMTPEDRQNPDLRNASGFCATGIQLADRRLAVLRIALDLDIKSRSLEELHSPGEPWATRISKEMKRSGQYSDEEINRFLQINVALHEYGHAMHTDAGLSHWGATDTKIPIEPYIATGASWFQTSEQELLDVINIRKRNKISFWSDDEDDQTAEVLIELVTASAIERQYDPAKARSLWANKLTDTLSWDGVTDQDKRSRIVRELGKVSGYASTSYSEGVAESVARREGSSGAIYSVDQEAQRHLRYVYTKQEKMKKEEEPITMVNICSGYLRKGPDGKLVPIPKPKKEKNPVFALPKE